MTQKLLIINIAGLSATAIGDTTPHLNRLAAAGSGPLAVQPPIPALTCTSQATLLTGASPSQHGVVSNGWYFRDLALVLNWQRSGRLMAGEPIWETVRACHPNVKAANLFWRFATHSSCQVHIAERPTYWVDGRKSPDIYTEPSQLRDELVERLGPFPLFRFWGPAAGIESTCWIVDATLHLLAQGQQDLLLTYIPHLDYDHQRYGPTSSQGKQALSEMDREVGRLLAAADEQGVQVAVVSDYAFEPVSQPVFLNRVLRQAGLVRVQRAENGELLEPGASQAFAVCDQQTAHIYVNDRALIGQVKQILERTEGVERVLNRAEMESLQLAHSRSGELFVVAARDCWFAYPYWLDESQAPDFAHCVAIHAKPGWDPSELFLRPGWKGKYQLAKRIMQKRLGIRAPFDVISGDMTLVRGSHGRIPMNNEQRPLLITSWPIKRDDFKQSDIIPMQDVKPILTQCFDR